MYTHGTISEGLFSFSQFGKTRKNVHYFKLQSTRPFLNVNNSENSYARLPFMSFLGQVQDECTASF